MSENHKNVREGGGYQQLTGKTSLDEILQTATSFEKTAWDFYAELSQQVGKQLAPLVRELAEEEERHFNLFTNLRKDPKLQDQIHAKITTPESDHRFSDFVHSPHLEDFPDDQSVLQYAIGREQAAMEQYTALAEETPAGPAKDLFQFLAQEELDHKKELEKVYYELIHLNFDPS